MKHLVLLFLVAFAVGCSKPAPKPAATAVPSLESFVDSLVQPEVDSARIAGLAIAVYKGTDQLLLKSYGSADLDLSVPMPPDASFEIGSVTKQFTAAAIMQLVDQGKVSLDDDFTKYVKFNTRGKKVTVRQLMNHTSGIKGYTEMPMFAKLAYLEYKRDTLLRIVEKEKFDFEPGELLIYNNTAFFILGLVIEKVSGMTYAEYVQHNLFDKADMSRSYYGDERKIVKRRAHGYDTGEKGLMRGNYLDHTWPYAAGSLCSTVEDLVKWNQALHHGRIMSEASYKEFLTPAVLNNGAVTRYAKGITVWSDNGTPVIAHGGGIFGFLSENSYYPSEDVSVIVLINTTGPVSPEKIAEKVGQKLLHIAPYKAGTAPADLNAYLGTYRGPGRGEDAVVKVTASEGTLWFQLGDRPATKLTYDSGTTWRNVHATFTFEGTEKSMTTLKVDQIYGYMTLVK